MEEDSKGRENVPGQLAACEETEMYFNVLNVLSDFIFCIVLETIILRIHVQKGRAVNPSLLGGNPTSGGVWEYMCTSKHSTHVL